MKLWYADSGSTVAPYGQEDVPELKSVFELPHLKNKFVFLDTQCTSLHPSGVKRRVDHSRGRSNADGDRTVHLSSSLHVKTLDQT
jgi:hypothetical protein